VESKLTKKTCHFEERQTELLRLIHIDLVPSDRGRCIALRALVASKKLGSFSTRNM